MEKLGEKFYCLTEKESYSIKGGLMAATTCVDVTATNTAGPNGQKCSDNQYVHNTDSTENGSVTPTGVTCTVVTCPEVPKSIQC